MDNELIFSKVEALLDKLDENQKLQKLAKDNGLDVKNGIDLTEDTYNNIAVSVVSLLLAKQAGDSDYKRLVQSGIQKRSLKIGLINKYKNQANQLLSECKNRKKNAEFA